MSFIDDRCDHKVATAYDLLHVLFELIGWCAVLIQAAEVDLHCKVKVFRHWSICAAQLLEDLKNQLQLAVVCVVWRSCAHFGSQQAMGDKDEACVPGIKVFHRLADVFICQSSDGVLE